MPTITKQRISPIHATFTRTYSQKDYQTFRPATQNLPIRKIAKPPYTSSQKQARNYNQQVAQQALHSVFSTINNQPQ